MAIRYSGDVEVRMQYGGAGYIDPASGGTSKKGLSRQRRDVYFDPNGKGFYYAHIRAPHLRNAAILSLREIGLTQKQSPTSSEAFDDAALAFLKWSEIHVGELPVELDDRNRIVVRRVFQSPCPIPTDRRK